MFYSRWMCFYLLHFHSFDFYYLIGCESCIQVVILFYPCFYFAIDCKCIAYISQSWASNTCYFHFLCPESKNHLISFGLCCYFCNPFQYAFHPLHSNTSDVLTHLVLCIKHCSTYFQLLHSWIHILSCFILFVIFSISFIINNVNFISTFNCPGNLISCLVQEHEKIKQCAWLLFGL